MGMNWKSIGKHVAKLGLPLLGTALVGPGGGAIGAGMKMCDVVLMEG